MPEGQLLIDELEESELSGENGEVYLFRWLSLIEKRIAEVPMDDLKLKQSTLESSLIKIISAPEPYPTPGRAFRNLVARCLIALYTRGETRTLFDTLQSFMKIAGDFKTQDKDMVKMAAFSCIGDIMAVFGSQYMSFMAEIYTISIKTFRSSNSSLLRQHALVALKKALTTARRAITDAAAKDILKQMRNGLTDKSLPVQRAAAHVISAMYSGEGNLPSANDVDAIVAQCVKSLESADQATRHAFAQLVGHMLASTQVERAIPTPAPAHKAKKEQDDNEAGVPATASSAADVILKTTFTPNEMLSHLSTHFNKPNASRKIRIGIFDFYAALLTRLGPSFVETNFSLIVAHLMSEIVNHPKASSSRYEALLARSLVGVLLRDLIGVQMLSEQAQISAIQELANAYLKRWPAMMPGQVAPTSAVLTIVLREVAGLLQQLGNAPPPVQDALADPLVTLLGHPSHTTRVTASWALRCFCYSTPLRLPKIILSVMEMLQRDMNSITSPAAPSDVHLRSLGHAYGLAALVSIIPERPLYVSYDVSAKVLDMAIQLLKRAGDHDLRVAGVEVEVAWISIAALMALGPNFVRPHLPQLLVLWRNALPKPTSKDTASNIGRSVAEWMFLLRVRENALGAILSFLQHNSAVLVTLDVGRRIASVLSNALQFANNFVSQNVEDPSEIQTPEGTRGLKGLNLRAAEALLRRRVYQCFTALGFSSIPDSTQTALLQSAVALFASPDGYAGSSVQAAIASSAGNFTSVWQSVDGYAYGVTSREVADTGNSAVRDDSSQPTSDYLNRDTIEVSIDAFLRKPVIGGCEHDPLSLCGVVSKNMEYRPVEPPPPATSVVDTAIELFAQLLPLQDLTSTVRIVTLLLDSVRSSKLDKNAGRKAAVFVNAAIGIVLALRQACSSHFRQARDTFGSTQVTSLLSPFLKDALIDGDIVLRSASSESIGRLASLSGTSFLTAQIKDLVDQVVSNRDPYGRAGCALAFGSIYSHVGGLAAGPLLKTTVNVLMSLGNDPHPTVHFWALNALACVINAASLGYSPFVPGTLGMLLKVYLLESHERGGGTLSNANLSGDHPAYPVVCQIIDAVINVLGPDMQESPRTRTLVLNLVHEFSMEDDEAIYVEATKCIQHFLMFAPEHVDIPDLVKRFRGHLSSSRRPLKLASINALYQLVQKDALAMSRLGGDQLVEDLFGMLDDDPSIQGVRNVISSWLEQTVIHNPSAWIDLCQRIMSKTTASQQVADAAIRQNLRDDEGDSLNLGLSQDPSGGIRTHGTSRWRTQLFALQCLHQICTIVARSGRKEHIDPVFARNRGLPASGLLVTRVPDLIKMAFTASAAYVTEIRLEGLVVLRDVIQTFSATPDPAYDDTLLLEQHQAPITSALTPAFSADSTPEILASAVNACAIFVGSGIVKHVSRMGRILKLLVTALEQAKDTGMVSLGETGMQSPNASAMLRISTLSAWAQLQVASPTQTYLDAVVNPHRAVLASLWIAALRDYASIRVDSEFLHDSSTVALDSSYSSLGKEVLLPYYAKSWSVILQAIATCMSQQDPYILAAMDGQEQITNEKIADLRHREDPSALFFVVFGLVFEALATSSADSSVPTLERQTLVLSALQALKNLVKPEYSGKAMKEPALFDEFMSLCYRLALTESAVVKIHLVEMLSVLSSTQDSTQELSSTTEPMSLTSPRAHCLRICANILRHANTPFRGLTFEGELTDRVRMVTAAFTAITSIAASTPTSQREDIRGLAGLLYSELLKDESSEIDLVGPTLPSLKAILDVPTITDVDAEDRYNRLVHGLLSACLVNIDAMSGRVGTISTKKVKNNLLTAVLILTVIRADVPISQVVIEHCCSLISQKLVESDDSQISLTAAHCAKTLIVAATSGHKILLQCSRFLVPSLIEYVAKVSPLASDGSISDIQSSAVGEVWKAFSSLFNFVPEQHRVRLLAVLLPTLSLLLMNSSNAQSPVKSQTVAQLLQYATASPAAFKEAAAELNSSTKELLEQAIRRAVGGTTATTATAVMKPQISLRSF